MSTATRNLFKLKEVMQLMKTGNQCSLTLCSFDKNRPEKSGKKIVLKNVTYASNSGYADANVRLANGNIQSIHPIHILRYNGTRVIP